MKPSKKTARAEAEQYALPNTETSLSPAVIPAPTAQDAEMGAQLTTQFKRAKATAEDAVLQAVVFGTMMLKLRQHIFDSAAESKHAGSGRFAKGTGVKAWLAANAPEVPQSTAHDWMALAEGLQKHFQLKASDDVAMLLTRDKDELSAKLAKKAAKIRQFLEGRSQRQLQLVFGNKPLGGKRERGPETSAEPSEVDPSVAAADIWKALAGQLFEEGVERMSWAHLSPAMLDQVDGILMQVRDAIKGNK